MRLRYFLVGLICGLILMGVAMGENTHVYVGQMRMGDRPWSTIETDTDRHFVERHIERTRRTPNYTTLDYRLLERSCDEKVLRSWNGKP